jgi:hypothetical protein
MILLFILGLPLTIFGIGPFWFHTISFCFGIASIFYSLLYIQNASEDLFPFILNWIIMIPINLLFLGAGLILLLKLGDVLRTYNIAALILISTTVAIISSIKFKVNKAYEDDESDEDDEDQLEIYE